MSTATAAGPDPAYAMDNHHPASAGHHRALARLLDEHTRRRIAGLRDLSGATCLEIGAGGGSIARWLADQVGPAGRVVATDLKPDHIPSHPQLRVVVHDHDGDRPWPPDLTGPFDLICARLVLSHLPGRRTILSQLAQRLGPGGVLLVEDWAPWSEEVLVAAPSPGAAWLYTAYQTAIRSVLEAAGTDRTWARRVYTAMREEGLTAVETVVHGGYWTGGGPGCALVAAVVRQLWPRLLAAGMTGPQLTELVDLLADPELVLHGHPLYSTSGRRG